MRKIKKNGKFFFVGDSSGFGINKRYWDKFERGLWENNTFTAFDAYLDNNHSYIDVGAWVGPTVLYASQKAKHCYALEPDPIAFKTLRENVESNPKLKLRIILFNACLNDKSGEIKLSSPSELGDSSSSILCKNPKKSVITKAITLEQLIEQNSIQSINFIKIDTEGAEVIILPAIEKYLRKEKPTLHLSLHPSSFTDFLKDSEAIINILALYKNVFGENGKPLDKDALMTLLSKMKSFAVIATDKSRYRYRLLQIFRGQIYRLTGYGKE